LKDFNGKVTTQYRKKEQCIQLLSRALFFNYSTVVDESRIVQNAKALYAVAFIS